MSVERAAARRGRTAATPGGVTFAQGRNARGTSVTFRIAWRARAIRAEPELFLEQVRDLLQVIATEATTYYESARSGAGEKTRRKRRGGGVAAASDAWRTAIARDEAELSAAEARVADGRADAPPGDDNPMPVPPSQRRPGDAGPAISPRLLAGLSIPMLAERLKRRPASYQQLESHVSDVERQADDARRRVRELVDAEESERQGGVGGVGGVGAPERRASPEQG